MIKGTLACFIARVPNICVRNFKALSLIHKLLILFLMPQRIRIKRNPWEQVYLLQAYFRLEIIRAKLTIPTSGVVTLKQLQEAKEEIEDYEKFCKFHNVRSVWYESL